MSEKDIRISWDRLDLLGDFLISNNDLTGDETLETAVLISLFTDRRAAIDDLLPDEKSTDRRGWFGDLVADVDGDQIGSRLWLLSREKTSPDVLVRAKEYVEESLEWMIEDNVAESVDVQVARQGTADTAILAFKVQITKPDASRVTIAFDDQWRAQADAV